MRLTSILLVVALVLALLSGCSQPKTAQIVATTLPVYQFTVRICSNTGISVSRLVTESVSCLHDYSLNVDQVRAIESAEAVILSGAGLEGFMDDLTHPAQTVIDSSVGIQRMSCGIEHDHDHEDGHNHDEDAHLWLSPANAKCMAGNICQGLINLYPEHEDAFRSNLKALLEDLDALEEYGKTQLASLSCRELITFHDGFGYLAQAFDLHILEAIEEESGSEASAKELIHMIELVRSHQLPAIFTERNGSVSAADIISRETGSTVFQLDMAMAGNDYFEAMYHNIDTIREALG